MKPSSLDDPLWEDRYKAGRIALRGAMEQNPTLDQFSTWTLGTAGVGGGFVVLNADKLSNLLNTGWSTWFAGFLALSLLFGIFQKFYAVRGQYFLAAEKSMFEQLPVIFNDYFVKILRAQPGHVLTRQELHEFNKTILEIGTKAGGELKRAAPLYLKPFISAGMKAAAADALAPMRLGTSWFFAQFAYTMLQMASLAAAVVSFVLFLKYR